MDILDNVKRVDNPPNKFASEMIEWIDCDEERRPAAKLEVYEEIAKTIIATNDSPDIGFDYSVNPYRGCFHGCAYCYARPTHQYLDFGAGSDFERRIVVKTNAPELLREAFEKSSWQGDAVHFSGVTDCYQPLELQYEITKRCLEVCLEYKNPVSIITKSAIIKRDIELLAKLSKVTNVSVTSSLAFGNDQVSKLIEPFAPRPSIRYRAFKSLHEAGIPIGIGLAPVIPGLNDHEIPKILETAASIGARWAFITLLRLPAETAQVFKERLLVAFPNRAQKILNQLRDMKGGKLNRSDFGDRMRGEGPRWEAIKWLFKQKCESLGLNSIGDARAFKPRETFQRPKKYSAQLDLFEA